MLRQYDSSACPSPRSSSSVDSGTRPSLDRPTRLADDAVDARLDLARPHLARLVEQHVDPCPNPLDRLLDPHELELNGREGHARAERRGDSRHRRRCGDRGECGVPDDDTVGTDDVPEQQTVRLHQVGAIAQERHGVRGELDDSLEVLERSDRASSAAYGCTSGPYRADRPGPV
ncbi:MAG: hypothetical protein NVV66_09225 [Cellulomonas sp.]|uniref:hypothetical protein n=1 Tax=Cellulomonas sp. TaxID=40001 RepID=UPI00258F1729|nr:hypothetical protein [Cellulomonas sp.]MCR6704853.1 hypothetical protein [Cellulomonas sp.]